MSLKLKNQIVDAFKMHGYTLRSDATKYLVEVLRPVDEAQRDQALDKLLEVIQRQPLTSSMIGQEICETAVNECNEEEEDCDKILHVINAFEVPRLKYMPGVKKFIHDTPTGTGKPGLLGDANTKADLFRERYFILHQRTSRHELFTPAILGEQKDSKKFQLKPIEFLLGSTSKLGDMIILGMLTQLKEGKWFIEDATGFVQLDLSRAHNFHIGLFTENCFVLAEGWYEDEIFHVNAFGFPPPEPATITRSYFGNINFFGGPSAVSAKDSGKLKQIEQRNEDAMIVILSDVWLDNVKVVEKLKILFSGYSEMPPVCFIFCGNFTSTPYGQNHIKNLKDSLKNLADVLSGYPTLLEQSRFIFVPGPQDPGFSIILPRPTIPAVVTEDFLKRVPNAEFTTNPCRIQYCTREIVVFREDIVVKMCRNCVRYPTDGDISKHFSKTVICQAHLCPLPLHVVPVYWASDNAMRIYPLPDLIVCADKYDPYIETEAECTVTNPGSFPRSDYAFKVYYPATGQIEDSKISEDF